MNDYPISQLRIVRILFKTHSLTYYMHESQVDAFVRASIRLYYEDGHPDFGNQNLPKDSTLRSIFVDPFLPHVKTHKCYSPDFEENTSAKINQIDYIKGKRVWVHPDVLEREEIINS